MDTNSGDICMNMIDITKNVLFIVPRRTFRQEYLYYVKGNDHKKQTDIVASASSNPVVPYGVLSIATYIKTYSKHSIDVRIVDFNVEKYTITQTDDIITNILKTFKPNIVGISALFSPTYDSIEYYCSIVKNYNPAIITVAGGACATNEYMDLLEETPSLDAICYSEGEIPFLNLVNADNFYDILENDTSFITKKSIAKGRKPNTSFIYNLDELPFIDYNLIDTNLYKHSMNNNTFKHENKVIEEPIYLPIHTTRGCPFNCVFCAAASVHGKRIRYMSDEYVIANIKNMIEKYGLTHLSIEDDQFLLKNKRAKKILKSILDIKEKINICTLLVTPSFIDDEIVALLKEAGVKEIALAMEHGSEYVLKEIIDKPFSINDIKNAVTTIKKFDMAVVCALVIGLPGERDEDREGTVRLIKEMGVDWTTFSIATPFKGSRLYEICIENGYVTKEDMKNADLRHAIIKTKDLNPEYITKKVYMMNLELNFVHNYRMRIGDYKTAVLWFEKVIGSYPLQAFAHYYLSKAYEGMNEREELIDKHMSKFNEIIASNNEWLQFAESFGLC